LSFIFLDSADSQPHQKFSLAHEVAHYLLDYHLPRQKVIERLTKTTLEVLDGLRQPTLTERVSGLLEGVELTPHTHFMERGAEGDILSREILRIEERADRLALELLAPYKQAYPAVRDGVHNLTGKSVRLQAAFTVLQETFKLPPNVARAYTQRLLSDLGEGDSTRNWLFGE
jgi:Zn-dependent peptidase ImmA (M78 family)